ncbi:hypothetical protein ACFW04_014109 [Cataglyphis niger]
MVEQRISRLSSSTWRLCGNYRVLNATTIPNRYPLPYIQAFTADLHGKSIFIKIDLVKAYYQVPVAKEDIPKTAVTIPFGLFEFLVMPFGLRNAAQTFQRLMNIILSGLDFCFCYLDNILIAFVDEKEHSKHLHTVFNRFKQFGITINLSKCLFGKHEIPFLGYLVSKQGIKPTSENVKAIIDYKKPKTIHENSYLLVLLPIFCDCSTVKIRPYVPQQLRKKIFDVVHSLYHPSGCSTCKLIQQKFIWPTMKKDIKEWARSYLPCPRAKVQKNTKNLLQKIAVSDQRFQYIHLDLIGPLPIRQNFRYCLTMIDRFSRWSKKISLTKISDGICYFSLLCTLGSALFKALTNLINCERIRTSVYHPASNGILERWHRTFNSAFNI